SITPGERMSMSEQPSKPVKQLDLWVRARRAIMAVLTGKRLNGPCLAGFVFPVFLQMDPGFRLLFCAAAATASTRAFILLMSTIAKTPTIGYGAAKSVLSPEELGGIVRERLSDLAPGSRVLAIIPDKTRDDNTHILFPIAAEALISRGIGPADVL